MNKKILVPLAEGFEEIETVTIVDVLRRAELDVTLAGVGADELRPIVGSRGIAVQPDAVWSAVTPSDFDAIVLPGGMGGTLNLIEEPSVLAALGASDAAGKLTAAICAAPLVLDAAGLIERLASLGAETGQVMGEMFPEPLRLPASGADVRAWLQDFDGKAKALADHAASRGRRAVAKFYAAEAGKRVVHAAQHLHGGIGVDREYPLHRYFLYARQLELTLGGGTPHLLELGRLLAAS